MKKSLRLLIISSIVGFVSFSNSQIAFAADEFDVEGRLAATSDSGASCFGSFVNGVSWKLLANSNNQVTKVQVFLIGNATPSSPQTIELYSDSSGDLGTLIGTLNYTSKRATSIGGLSTFITTNPITLTSGNYYWLKVNTINTCPTTTLTFNGSALSLNLDAGRVIARYMGVNYTQYSTYMAIFGEPVNMKPTAPTSVVATATGKRSATVSFAAPASNGGSAITSYTVTSSPGGITKTLNQATGGTFTFDNLQPSTSYTFAVTATNSNGTSSTATSNSIKTLALDVASISALSFADDGTGTGGKIVWAGKNIDAVLYTGPAASYPGPYNYGAFTGGWNGRIRNLTPNTSYTVSIFAVSADGVGESKSLTFKTSATLPALAGSASATVSQAAQMATQLPKIYAWINENVFVDGEGDRMKTVLNKFDAMAVPAHSAFLKLPNSSVVSVSATSSTPAVCKVEGQVTVHSIASGTCTISYTVSGASKAPVTMVKDFVFAKFAK